MKTTGLIALCCMFFALSERAIGASMILAQVDVRIPSDAALDRDERKAITTPPLSLRDAPLLKGSEESQNREMDRDAARIDRELQRGICADCR